MIQLKRFNITLLLLVFALPYIGQAQKCPSPPPYDSLFKRNVYSFVEEMPAYLDGTAALMKYIGQNLTYPAIAKENGVEGKPRVEFIVEANGTIKDIIAGRNGKSSYVDEALANVIKGMPPWKPGKCNGEAVAVKFSLSISCIKLG